MTTSIPEPTQNGSIGLFPLEFGLDTFGDYPGGRRATTLHAQTIRNVVEQGVLAERVGSTSSASESTTPNDFPMPAADVVLAAIAARTDASTSALRSPC